MIAAVLLLLAAGALCSDGARNHTCPPSEEERTEPQSTNVVSFRPDDYVNASGPVSIELLGLVKLNISLEGLSEYPVCQWLKGADPILTINQSLFMITSVLSEADSGQYNLSCETDGASRSLAVELRVVIKRPTKPRLMLVRYREEKLSYYDYNFTCTSEGSPKPTIKWTENRDGKDVPSNGKTTSSISSLPFEKSEVMCCATNAEGQECHQTYDYDLDSSTWTHSEFSNVTLSPGDSLLLRCLIRRYRKPDPVWERGGSPVKASICGTENEVCIGTEIQLMHRLAYLFIRSLRKEDSGTYTCRHSQNKTKSVYINVQAEGLLSAQLDESKIISAHDASCTCLSATVSYHPVLQQCSWEAPDKHMTKCIRDKWVTKHRTVKLCEPLTSGDYKLHLKSGPQNETKTISVCVVDTPKFKQRNFDGNIIVETVSFVPANHFWMFCSSSNESCDSDSSWKVIPNTFERDDSFFCNKTIRRSLSKALVGEQYLRFCLTNSFGSWCTAVYSSPQPVKGEALHDDNMTLLKVGSLCLLLALAVVSLVLLHFIRKKKPQYQPQLQMIQMVGPNDNDYIYINFKDFEYNRKWEFPRENLELGKELGSGAFGMVVHATAYGINKPGVSQQVAVKMLKEKHQSVEKEALMSELKMLTQIGHHVNIVNLLGACTDMGPIYLIFQYCCFGDLLNYLKSNSKRYHKSVTDAFNKDRFSSLYHNLEPRKKSRELEAAVNNYVAMHRSTTRGQEDIALLTLNSSDVDDGYEDSEMFETDDETDDLQALTFDDLLSFALQVSKGMEFLSSKNCIHRDLAARNVLVTKGRLVKIGDFGLARDIDNDSNYVVKGNVRLPVKWMAPESIFHGMYTMKSDVWAYGILLWEIFSLGVTPYPGMKVDHKFYSMIDKGFKMEAPYYANSAVYEMMCNCWALDPCDRPAFSKLVTFMCGQLTDREEKLYRNMLDQTSSDSHDSSAILDISALTQQNKGSTPSANNYCQTCPTAGGKTAETPDVVESEKELLKQSDHNM